MQKLLLRIACSVLTLAVGLAAAKIHRLFSFRTTIPKADRPGVANEVVAEKVWRCEATLALPRPITVLLDRNFPGWQFPIVSDDDCQSVRTWGGEDAYPQLIRGDFDGNGRLDYAVLIEHGSATDNQGLVIGPNVHVIAFLEGGSGYRMRTVTREGGGCLQLMRKGDRDYDYEADREFTYALDTIFSGWGMGGTSYLYENGKFRAIITSD